MKKLLVLVMAVLLVLSAVPAATFAIEENDKGFEDFLEESGWSKEDYVAYLASKDWTLEDFDSADELGTPLSEEGVQEVMADFKLTREELNSLLIEYGDIEEGEDVLEGTWIIFNEELYWSVEFYLNEEDFSDFDEELTDLFSEIGLTDDELDRMFEHFMTLDVENEAFGTQLEALLERMYAIEEFESADDLDAEQIAELLSIFTEMMDLFEIQATYYLTDGKEKQPLNLSTLMTLETTNGMDLLIEIYNVQGTFLADVIFTAEMFGSDIIRDTEKDLETVKEVVTAPKKEVKTVKGGKLPKTGSDYGVNALIGLSIVLIGLLLFRRMKTVGN